MNNSYFLLFKHNKKIKLAGIQSEELGWGAYILVVALSIHSILEGIAIGLADTVEDLITLFLSVIIHEVCLKN